MTGTEIVNLARRAGADGPLAVEALTSSIEEFVRTGNRTAELLDALQEESAWVLYALIEALRSQGLGGIKTLVELITIADHESMTEPAFNGRNIGNREVRAVCILSAPFSPEVEALILQFAESDDGTVAAAACRRLPELGTGLAETKLRVGLSNNSWEVRMWALNGLARLGIANVIRYAIDLIDDPNSEVRLEVATILKASQDPEAKAALKTLSHDVNPEVRNVAQQNLD